MICSICMIILWSLPLFDSIVPPIKKGRALRFSGSTVIIILWYVMIRCDTIRYDMPLTSVHDHLLNSLECFGHRAVLFRIINSIIYHKPLSNIISYRVVSYTMLYYTVVLNNHSSKSLSYLHSSVEQFPFLQYISLCDPRQLQTCTLSVSHCLAPPSYILHI